MKVNEVLCYWCIVSLWRQRVGLIVRSRSSLGKCSEVEYCIHCRCVAVVAR